MANKNRRRWELVSVFDNNGALTLDPVHTG